MRLTRTIWVLDINDYLTYIEQCLNQIAFRYPWITDNSPIDRNWRWKDAYRVDDPTSQREELINWIITQELYEVFYICPAMHVQRHPEFSRVHNELVCHFDLHDRTGKQVFIPKFYGDIQTHSITRQACWLYIESDVSQTQLGNHVLPPIPSTRY